MDEIKNKKGLSIIIPVFNEVDGIEDSIQDFKKLVSDQKFSCEVIFVNDGSDDGTEVVLSNLDLDNESIKIINHKNNRGYGAALKTGIKNSKYDYIAITDADKTYPNDKIPSFYEIILKEDHDMVVGARVGKNVKIPIIRKPAKWFINTLANYLSGVKIPDINSGLRVMRKSVLDKYIKILPDGFSFTTTITLAMLTNGYSVCYKKIDYFHRSGSSKIRPIYDTFNFIQLIVRTILLFKPLKVFLPISIFLILFGIGLIIYRLLINDVFGVSSTVIIVGGIQLLAIGMLADLIDRRLD